MRYCHCWTCPVSNKKVVSKFKLTVSPYNLSWTTISIIVTNQAVSKPLFGMNLQTGRPHPETLRPQFQDPKMKISRPSRFTSSFTPKLSCVRCDTPEPVHFWTHAKIHLDGDLSASHSLFSVRNHNETNDHNSSPQWPQAKSRTSRYLIPACSFRS